MIEDGRTLLVVADGRKARVFEEARRGGALHERAEWLSELPPFSVGEAGSPGRVYDRFGHAGHGVTSQSPHDKAEHEFLAGLVEQLDWIMREQEFDDLVLIAAPKALGVLREVLPKGLVHKLKGSDAHDRLAASIEDLHAALRAIRRESA